MRSRPGDLGCARVKLSGVASMCQHRSALTRLYPAFDLLGLLFFVPIVVERPTCARQTGRVAPLIAAAGTAATGVERVPHMPAAIGKIFRRASRRTHPAAGALGLPLAQRTADASRMCGLGWFGHGTRWRRVNGTARNPLFGRDRSVSAKKLHMTAPRDQDFGAAVDNFSAWSTPPMRPPSAS